MNSLPSSGQVRRDRGGKYRGGGGAVGGTKDRRAAAVAVVEGRGGTTLANFLRVLFFLGFGGKAIGILEVRGTGA